MKYLVGTDEAGYGPNLGPLVISATLWEVPEQVGCEDLFRQVQNAIAPAVNLIQEHGPFVAMADSKTLYSPGKGLRHLERGLWAALGLCDCRPATWRDVWQCLAPEALDALAAIPWYADHDEPAPFDGRAEDRGMLIALLHQGLAAAGVRLISMRSRVIFEGEFNDLVEQHGLKSTALSHETLALAARMIEPLPAGSISMVCDKHGGRNRYGSLLAEHFPDYLIEVRGEARERSLYRFGPSERRIDVCFRMKAESCLPAALASMASKYLRELAMRALNDFWHHHIPGLQPTAGYPQDAKRFRADIAETIKQLHIPDRLLWRMK